MAAESTAESSVKSCLICLTPVTVPYYGVDACRACASFFKRSKLAGKAYSCRKGNNKCEIKKDERFTCRSCRYDRCVTVGMTYDKAAKQRKKISNPAAEVADPSTSKPSREPMLKRIAKAYNESVERRRTKELSIMWDLPEQELISHPTQEMRMGTYATLVQTFNIAVDETRLLYEKCFPMIKELTEDEQVLLAESYITKFIAIDSALRTRKLFGEVNKSIWACSVTTCLDVRRVEAWFGKEEGAGNREELIRSVQEQCRALYEILAPAMNRSQITDKEFHALIAMQLCDIDGATDIPDNVNKLVDDIRIEVLQDLQQYYKEDMAIDDFSTRLGNLITLNHAIREYNDVDLKFYQMQQTIFDIYILEDRVGYGYFRNPIDLHQ